MEYLLWQVSNGIGNQYIEPFQCRKRRAQHGCLIHKQWWRYFSGPRFNKCSKRWELSQCDHCGIEFGCEVLLGMCTEKGCEDLFERESIYYLRTFWYGLMYFVGED